MRFKPMLPQEEGFILVKMSSAFREHSWDLYQLGDANNQPDHWWQTKGCLRISHVFQDDVHGIWTPQAREIPFDNIRAIYVDREEAVQRYKALVETEKFDRRCRERFNRMENHFLDGTISVDAYRQIQNVTEALVARGVDGMVSDGFLETAEAKLIEAIRPALDEFMVAVQLSKTD